MFAQPSATVDLVVKDDPETSDDLSSSYFNEDAWRFQKERQLVDFDSILSPEQVKGFGSTGNDDEMYESSSFDAKQPEVSQVVGTPEYVRFAPVRSPESLDVNFKEEGRTVESGRRPVAFRNNTSPFGRCSESNMQGALNCGQRKQSEGRNRTLKASHQPYGSSLCSDEIQEIEELSSDDSLDSLKRWNVEKRQSERTAKRSLIEIGQRVTRSKTQSSPGLPLSTEKQARKDALDALRRKKDSRTR